MNSGKRKVISLEKEEGSVCRVIVGRRQLEHVRRFALDKLGIDGPKRGEI